MESSVIDWRGYPIEVRRRKVKYLTLRIRADASILLTLPLAASEAAAHSFLERKADWILSHRAAAERRIASEQANVYLFGEPILPPAGGVEALYRTRLSRLLPSLLHRFAGEMGVDAPQFSLRQMTTRYGSCTPSRGRVRFALSLAQYPIPCIAYIVIHELAHLIEPSHSPRFWQTVGRHCPCYKAFRTYMKQPLGTPLPASLALWGIAHGCEGEKNEN